MQPAVELEDGGVPPTTRLPSADAPTPAGEGAPSRPSLAELLPAAEPRAPPSPLAARPPSKSWLAAALAAGSTLPLGIALAVRLALAGRHLDLVVFLSIAVALSWTATAVRVGAALPVKEAALCALMAPLGGQIACAALLAPAHPLLASDLSTHSAAAAAALLAATLSVLFQAAALRATAPPALTTLCTIASLFSVAFASWVARPYGPSTKPRSARATLQVAIAAASIAAVLSLAHGAGRWVLPAILLAASPVSWRRAAGAETGDGKAARYEGRRSGCAARACSRSARILLLAAPYALGLLSVVAGLFLARIGLGIALVPLCYWLARAADSAFSTASVPSRTSGGFGGYFLRVACWCAVLLPTSLLGAMVEPAGFALCPASYWDTVRRRALIALMAVVGLAAEAVAGTWGKPGAGGSIALYAILFVMLIAEALLAARPLLCRSAPSTGPALDRPSSEPAGSQLPFTSAAESPFAFSLRLAVATSQPVNQRRASRVALVKASSFDRRSGSSSQSAEQAQARVVRALEVSAGGTLDLRLGGGLPPWHATSPKGEPSTPDISTAEPDRASITIDADASPAPAAIGEAVAEAGIEKKQPRRRCGTCVRFTATAVLYAAALFFLSMWVSTHDPDAVAWMEARGTIVGSNIGGWLLAERWMTKDWDGGGYVFDANSTGSDEPDEYEASVARRAENRTASIEAFRDTFITRADFEKLADVGINTVRLGFGYWIVAPDEASADPYVRGRGPGYLDDAIDWAEDLGLTVVLDLHGAPGSQNGEQTSGRVDHGWTQDDWDADGSLAAIRFVSERYASRSCVVAIELMNEPNIDAGLLLPFYQDATDIVRRNMRDDVAVVINLYYIHSVFTHA